MHTHQQGASAKLAARIGSGFAAAAFVLSGCGSAPSSSTSQSPQAAQYPLTVTQIGGGSVVINRRPAHIVSLSPTTTEMLFAIGAGPQVVAVDDQSDYPSTAPRTKLSGFQPNIEAIAAYGPDLVVAADDTAGLVHGLGALNTPVLIQPAAKSLDDTYREIVQLGEVTGQRIGADSLVKKMRSDFATLVATVSKPVRQLKIYHELDDTYYSATSATFIGQIYALLGLNDIADGATAAASDYPQLSAEYIVASSPDLIVLADTKCCHQNAATVAARPGWGSIAAVKSGQVIGVDDDIASRWGPRVIDFLKLVVPHVRQLELQAA